MKSAKQKIYCYVDETGQDVGSLFYIVTALVSASEQYQLRAQLLKIEERGRAENQYYLLEKSGIKYRQLLDMLIEFALKRAENQKKTQYTFNTSLLSDMASSKGGSKS